MFTHLCTHLAMMARIWLRASMSDCGSFGIGESMSAQCAVPGVREARVRHALTRAPRPGYNRALASRRSQLIVTGLLRTLIKMAVTVSDCTIPGRTLNACQGSKLLKQAKYTTQAQNCRTSSGLSNPRPAPTATEAADEDDTRNRDNNRRAALVCHAP